MLSEMGLTCSALVLRHPQRILLVMCAAVLWDDVLPSAPEILGGEEGPFFHEEKRMPLLRARKVSYKKKKKNYEKTL